jgi:hypothetical protein
MSCDEEHLVAGFDLPLHLLHVEVHLFVHSGCNKIKDGDDVAREVFELSVELRIELSQVLTIYFQNVLF